MINKIKEAGELSLRVIALCEERASKAGELSQITEVDEQKKLYAEVLQIEVEIEKIKDRIRLIIQENNIRYAKGETSNNEEAIRVIAANVVKAEGIYASTAVAVKKKEPEKKKASFNPKVLAIVLAVLVVLAGAGIGIKAYTGSDASQYKKAASYMADGNYADAIAIYDELGDYEDSKTLSEECKMQYIESLEKDKAFKEAYAYSAKLSDEKKAKDAKKKYAILYIKALADKKDNDQILADFEMFKDYKECDEYLCGAELAYIKKNKTAEDAKTVEYAKHLAKAKYDKADKVIADICNWKMSIVVSTKANADSSEKSISLGKNVVFTCKLKGDIEEIKTGISFKLVTPDGAYNNTSDKKWTSGDKDTIGWKDGNKYNGSKGTVKLVAYDGNGNEIGSKSVKIK